MSGVGIWGAGEREREGYPERGGRYREVKFKKEMPLISSGFGPRLRPRAGPGRWLALARNPQ